MRILVVTNLYPPHHIGGYEIGCRDVVEGLRSRNHTIRVLTSSYGSGAGSVDEDVWRELNVHIEPGGRPRNVPWYRKITDILANPFQELHNRQVWRKHLGEFQPDFVYFWNLSLTTMWPMIDVSNRGIPSACYISDQWFERIPEGDYWMTRLHPRPGLLSHLGLLFSHPAGRLLGLNFSWPPARLPHLQFTSQFIKDSLVAACGMGSGGEVIHWGVHQSFLECTQVQGGSESGRITVLYSGQLSQIKGTATAIRGFAAFLARTPDSNAVLRIAGTGLPEYVDGLKQIATDLGVADRVHFLGRLDRTELAAEYRRAEIYLFTSEWNEPFAIAPLEAMASSCAVIGTTTGGSGELFRDGENALTFNAGNPNELSECLETLARDSALRDKLAIHARRTIRDHFTMDGMIDRIETLLQQHRTS